MLTAVSFRTARVPPGLASIHDPLRPSRRVVTRFGVRGRLAVRRFVGPTVQLPRRRSDATEIANGFANRIVFCWVERARRHLGRSCAQNELRLREGSTLRKGDFSTRSRSPSAPGCYRAGRVYAHLSDLRPYGADPCWTSHGGHDTRQSTDALGYHDRRQVGTPVLP